MTTQRAPFTRDDIGQPEWRAAVLGEAIRHTAHLAGSINPFALTRHLLDWLGVTEEEAGGELTTIVFLMVRSGLYTTNTHDLATGDIWLGAETRLTPARVLTTYLHGEVEYAFD